MKLATSSMAGLAIGDREIACVQLPGAGRRGAKAARFDIPAGLSLADPETLGRALRAFLDDQKMGASRAIVGVPARWLIAEPRDVPPTGREPALASLRLQAERISLSDDAQLIFDVAGSFGDGKPGQALLVALSEDRLARIKRLCDAADITPVAVTATGLVVAGSLPPGAEQAVILFSGEGAELVWQSPRGLRAFRHLSGVRAGVSAVAAGTGAAREGRAAVSPGDAGSSASTIAPLTSELWRALSLSAGPSAGGVERITLLGDAGVSSDQCAELAGRLGRSVQCMAGFSALSHLPAASALNGQADRVASERIWPALALAGAGSRGVETLPVNFLRPKLAAPRPSRLNRTWTLAVLIAAVLVLGIGALWWQVRAMEAEADVLEQRLTEMKPDIAAAEAYAARVNYARGFFDGKPPVLDALADLSSHFGREDRIWTTSFSMRENNRGQITGRAVDQKTVLDLVRRLQEPGSGFTQVRVGDMREAPASGGARGAPAEIGFNISFLYLPRSERKEATP